MKMSGKRSGGGGGGSSGSTGGGTPLVPRSPGQVLKEGSLKKLKTNKKKYFVLRAEHGETAACLEYYDSEKKFRANQPPKRSITLKTCFNINKRSDTKHKYVIALYTKLDCFCIVLESEEEMEDWLKALLQLQLGQGYSEGEPVRPNFAHVWCVTVLSKDLGSRKNILGPYLLCLTDTTISLLRATSDFSEPIEFSLQKIRRCGHMNTFFYMEVGQCTVTGAGNLWMQTEDGNIAENMHTTILNACCNCSKREGGQQPQVQPEKQTPPPSGGSSQGGSGGGKLSRQHRNSESASSVTSNNKQPATGVTSNLRCSPSSTISTSGIHHQRNYSFPVSPPTRRASTGTRPVPTRSVVSHFWLSSRVRSDSMPSRNRTTSEGCAPHQHHPTQPHHQTAGPPASSSSGGALHHLISGSRPQSMYSNKCLSYSPPINSSPVSPDSVTCSTDSAGSSLSMDGDTVDGGGGLGSHWDEQRPSLILEEEDRDYPLPLPGGEDEKLNNYMQMDGGGGGGGGTGPQLSLRKQSLVFKASLSQCSGSDTYQSSPIGSPGDYLPMSPGDNRYGSQSQDSSLAGDVYVAMTPSDDGYVDMDHNNKQGSCGSITSGTPSTDIRFSEYPLDKVSTYFSPDEDTHSTNERPVRAYSVGSRPTPNINRGCDLMSAQTCERVRAFSVGSQNVRRFCRLPVSSSHSSVEPSDDMMELDFTKKGRKARKKPSSGSASTISSASSYSTAGDLSYPEMSPPRRFFGKSPPKASPPFLGRVVEEVRTISPCIKPALLSTTKRDDYLDMSASAAGSVKRKTEDNNNRLITSSSPSLGVGGGGAATTGDYVEMNCGSTGSVVGGGIGDSVVGGGGSTTTTCQTDQTDYVLMSAPSPVSRRGSQPIAIKASPSAQSKSELGVGVWSSGGTKLLDSSSSAHRASTEQGIFPFSPVEPSPAAAAAAAASNYLRSTGAGGRSSSLLAAGAGVPGAAGGNRVDEEEGEEEGVESSLSSSTGTVPLGQQPVGPPADIDRFIQGLGTIVTPGTGSLKKELHYASLELVKSNLESDESEMRRTKGNSEPSSAGCGSQSGSAELGGRSQVFNYAEIDFAKSASPSSSH